ncbi:hypothetical protein ACQ902_003174 [Vibrio mimicus]|nr:hypothetical protein [Vibrio cholerae]EHQ2334149.1 hypothetical protein [Vibrio cholerae]EJL6327701.1 hypothetical protein [Vibrio cholerae]EJL6591442.1 hypothetical protein [Vibrio cholerae]EJL6771809.1 hypothetical protein [Vibrio cholerae]
MNYPDDSLQNIVSNGDWWIKSENMKVSRGDLIWAFVPHVDQVPYIFTPIGRDVATEHSKAIVKVEPLTVGSPLKQSDLPVAAMPLHKNEVWSAHRAKKRPCVVLSVESSPVDKELIKGKANHSTAPTYIVAPYYGVDAGSKRAGYSEAFTERVRHCEYSQFLWDKLPLNGADESILRFDHLMPIGAHYNSYKQTGYRLSQEALAILDDYLLWHLHGGVPEESVILEYRELISEYFG